MKRKLKFHLTSYQDMRDLLLKTFSCVAIFMLCLCDVNAHVSLSYSEVEKYGNSCPRLDSCAHQRSSGRRQLISVKESNCACDYLCTEYGDCCIDAKGNEMAKHGNSMKCFELKQFGGVYMKDTCSPSYEGPDDVRHLCQETKIGDQTDPLGSMPVTDSLTGLTYKNYYCSMCNDKMDNIVLWTPRLECPLLTLFNRSKNITKEYVVQNLATDGRGWGLYLDGENGSLFFHDCDVDPVMPLVLESKIRLCKPKLISDCDPSFKDEHVRSMCKAYMGTKYVHGGDGYKNVHCAICNNVNVTQLSCQSAELRGIDIFREFGTHSFALLLDINEKGGQEVGKMRMCESGEIFDPFYKKCRSLTCLPGFVRRGRRCFIQNSVAVPDPPSSTDEPVISIHTEFSENNKSNVTYEHTAEIPLPDLKNLSTGKTYNISELADINSNTVGKLLNCLLISLVDEDYVMLPNRSIFVPKYNRLYEPTSYYASDGSILVCTHFPTDHETKFLPILGYVTIVGLGISMFFLMLHFVAFCIVPDLQNLSGKNLVSQCVALFFAYFCFIIGQFESLSSTSCTAVAFLTFYFFQVSFFWMGVMAFDVWRTLKMATTELRVSSGRQMKRFLIYSFFTWMTPLFILTLLAFAQYTSLFSPPYRPGFSSPPCWFKQRRSLLVFFATPLFTIMLANVILFIASTRMIVMTGQTSIKQQSKLQRRNFKLYLRLALLMGLTWIVGLLAGYTDITFLFYAFVVLNTLQGLFIFIAFSCSSKVLGYLENKFKLTSRPGEFKSSSNSASSGSAFSTKPTTLMIKN